MIKQKYNYLLIGCVLVLAVICFLSVNGPLAFERERAEREKVVEERLLAIQQAQNIFCEQQGHYAETFDVLIRAGLLADSLQYVPYSNQECFSLHVTVETTATGRSVPLMECGASYSQYLNGLDVKAIARLTEEAERLGNYPGIKIGGL